MAYLLRTGSLEGYLELMEELGADSGFLLRQAGLKRKIFDNPDTRIPFQTANQLLENSANHTGNTQIGLLMAFRRSGHVLGLFGILCRHSPDVATAINQAIRNIDLHNQMEHWELKNQGSDVILIRHIKDYRINRMAQMDDMALGDVARFLQSISEGSIKLKRVYLTHSAPTNAQIYNHYFKTEVLFNQDFNGVSFDQSHLSTKLHSQDRDIQKHLEYYIQSMKRELNDDIEEQTRHLIEQTLTSPDCNIEEISQLLAMHKRTLQKKLNSRGTSFSEILDQVRWGKAQQILSNSNMPISKLASLLGYSELSAFSRAFKEEFGTSPRQWRKNLQ